MRLKSEIWVKAYLRRCAGECVAAVVARRGQEDAGAIYVKLARLDGSAMLFAPAPAGFDSVSDERAWVDYFNGRYVSEGEVDDVLAQQASFDDDLWVIEVEDRAGRHFMDEWLAP